MSQLLAVQLPKAFSVRDEHELTAFQHLMHRLNSVLCVTEVAQGIHKEGGMTKFWGLVYDKTQLVSKADIFEALTEAGFDHSHNGASIKYELIKHEPETDKKWS